MWDEHELIILRRPKYSNRRSEQLNDNDRESFYYARHPLACHLETSAITTLRTEAAQHLRQVSNGIEIIAGPTGLGKTMFSTGPDPRSPAYFGTVLTTTVSEFVPLHSQHLFSASARQWFLLMCAA